METHAGQQSAREGLVYQFKESPYSSHSQVLGLFPQEGRGHAVLDVGCGNGYLGEILAARGYKVIGLERAGGYGPGFPPTVELIDADLERGLPSLPVNFDFVLCADILEHLRNPGTLLEEIPRVMKPGARLIASLPNSGNIYFRLNVLLGRFPQHEKGLFDRTHLRFYVLDGWRALLAASGYREESLRITGIPVGLAAPRYAQSIPIQALERISYELARLWKRLFAYQFVISATVDNGRTNNR